MISVRPSTTVVAPAASGMAAEERVVNPQLITRRRLSDDLLVFGQLGKGGRRFGLGRRRHTNRALRRRRARVILHKAQDLVANLGRGALLADRAVCH